MPEPIWHNPNTPEGAPMAMRTDYERMLEDAALALWDEMPVEQVKLLEAEAPRLVEFLTHLHHSISHEEAMVRRNYWAEPPHITPPKTGSEVQQYDGAE